jgi:AcrR family transcriptional regulator
MSSEASLSANTRASHSQAGEAPVALPLPQAAPAGASRKERARAEREEGYLAIARRLLLTEGYLGLTMDRVAAETEYSKGTLYQHFRNKEELLLALSQRITLVKAELFQRATEFRGRPRERMAAIGEAYRLWATHYPDDIRATQILRQRSLAAKVRPELQARHEQAEEQCYRALMVVIHEGVAAGDLTLPEAMQPEHVAFGLWSLSWGGWTLELLDFDLERLQIDDVGEQVRRHCEHLLDGYGWRPLTNDWDYAGTRARIAAEVFPELSPSPVGGNNFPPAK